MTNTFKRILKIIIVFGKISFGLIFPSLRLNKVGHIFYYKRAFKTNLCRRQKVKWCIFSVTNGKIRFQTKTASVLTQWLEKCQQENAISQVCMNTLFPFFNKPPPKKKKKKTTKKNKKKQKKKYIFIKK